MSTFKIEISTDNAAFGEDSNSRAAEVSRILHQCADQLTRDSCYADWSRLLFDINGNRVGHASYTGESLDSTIP